MKKSAGILFIALLAFSFVQLSLVLAEEGSSASASASVSSNSGSGEVNAEAQMKADANMDNRQKVGEVRRDIRQEVRGNVADMKEKIRNETGEFRQEVKQEIKDMAAAEMEKRRMEFEARLEANNGSIIIAKAKIKIANLTEDQKDIIAGKINAKTGLNLTADDVDGNGTALRAILSNGRYAEIKVLPDVAARVAVEKMQAKCEERNCTVELKEVSAGNNKTRAVYVVNTEKEARALFIFKTRMKVNAEVDSETGEVVKVSKPWWAFLASEKAEVDSELENETQATVEADANVSANLSS